VHPLIWRDVVRSRGKERGSGGSSVYRCSYRVTLYVNSRRGEGAERRALQIA
jgi:hypothetical protein